MIREPKYLLPESVTYTVTLEYAGTLTSVSPEQILHLEARTIGSFAGYAFHLPPEFDVVTDELGQTCIIRRLP